MKGFRDFLRVLVILAVSFVTFTSIDDAFASDPKLKESNAFRNVLRVLVTLAAILYALIFIDEAFPPYDRTMTESDFGMVMFFVLFIWFAIGYFYLWKDEKIAGIFLTTWWGGVFFTAFFFWLYWVVIVIQGFSIFILGILLLKYSKWKKNASENS